MNRTLWKTLIAVATTLVATAAWPQQPFDLDPNFRFNAESKERSKASYPCRMAISSYPVRSRCRVNGLLNDWVLNFTRMEVLTHYSGHIHQWAVRSHLGRISTTAG